MKEKPIEIVHNTSMTQKDEQAVEAEEEDHVVPNNLNQVKYLNEPVIEETHLNTHLAEEDFFSIQAQAEVEKSEPTPSVTSYNESKEQSYTSSMIDSNSSKDEEEEEEPESNNDENETLVLEKSTHERQDSDTDKHSLSSVDSGNGLSYEHTSSTNYNKVEEVASPVVVEEQVQIEEKTKVPSPEKEIVTNNKSSKSVKSPTVKKADKPANKRGGKAVASNAPITYTFTPTVRNAKKPASKHNANNRTKLSESKEPEIKNVDLKNIGEQNHENGIEDLVVYEFNFPRKLCGKLIGKSGVHVDSIRSKTHTQIAVRNDALVEDLQVVCISGKVHDVDKALDIISHRFPAKLYPQISFKPISKPILYRRFDAENNEQAKVLVASSMFVELPEQVVVETTSVLAAATVSTVKTPFSVHVTAIVNAAHVFIQLPTQSTFSDLQELDKSMLNAYDSISNEAIANLVEPIEYGTICAAPTSYGWHRAMITNYQTIDEVQMQLPDYNEACGLATVKFLDYGGYLNIPVNQLKQLR